MWPLGVLKKSGAPVQSVMLLHFDGTHGSTTFTDSSSLNHTFSVRNGTPIISTAQSKFGGSSLYLNGTSAIKTPDNADYELGTDDFTIEFFIRQTIANNSRYVLAKWLSGNSYQFYIGSTQKVAGYALGIGTSSTTSLPVDEWVHIAFVRQPTTLKLYFNGVLEATSAVNPASGVSDGTADLVIGGWHNGSSGFTGYIDELRISKTAVYTANFTPPTAPFS